MVLAGSFWTRRHSRRWAPREGSFSTAMVSCCRRPSTPRPSRRRVRRFPSRTCRTRAERFRPPTSLPAESSCFPPTRRCAVWCGSRVTAPTSRRAIRRAATSTRASHPTACGLSFRPVESGCTNSAAVPPNVCLMVHHGLANAFPAVAAGQRDGHAPDRRRIAPAEHRRQSGPDARRHDRVRLPRWRDAGRQDADRFSGARARPASTF